MFDTEDFAELMEKSKADIEQRLVEQLKTEVINSLSWSFRDQANGIVKEFFDKELKPQLQQELMAKKAELLQAMVIDFKSIGEVLSKALLAKATESIGNSYDLGRITEAMFK